MKKAEDCIAGLKLKILTKANVLYLLLAGLIAFVDQYTKIIAKNNISFGEQIEIIPGLFNLTLAFNKGAAFGFLAGVENDMLRVMALWILSGIAIIVVFYLFFVSQKESTIGKLGLAMIIGGATGNLIDRGFYGAVTDFLDFYIQNYHWPAFNIADSAICVGVVILIFSQEKRQEKHPNV